MVLTLIVVVLAALVVPRLTQLAGFPKLAGTEHPRGSATTDTCNGSTEVVQNSNQEDNRSLGPNNLPVLPEPFIGRDGDVEYITDIFLLGQRYSWAKIVSIYGLPAVGKSTLAIHVGYKMVHRGFAVRHINVRDANIESLFGEKQRGHVPSAAPGGESVGSDVAIRYADVGSTVDESIGGQQHKNVSTSELLDWAGSLQNETLLILDNCDHILEGNTSVNIKKTVAELIQASPLLRVLTTSRYKLFIVDRFIGYELKNLSDLDAVELLQFKSDSAISHSDAETIAGLVGNLPLALNVISGLLLSYNIPASEVIMQLRQSPLIQDVHHDLFKFSQEIHHALSMSYEYMDESTRECRYYLTTFPGSFSAHAAVRVLNDTVDIKHCLGRLKELSLIDQYLYEKEHRYQVHRLVREFFKRPSDLFQPPSLTDAVRCSFGMYYSQFLFEFVMDHTRHDVKGIGRFEYETHNFRMVISLLKDSNLMRTAEGACRKDVAANLYTAFGQDTNNLLLLGLTRGELVTILMILQSISPMYVQHLSLFRVNQSAHVYVTVNKDQSWNVLPTIGCPGKRLYSQNCCFWCESVRLFDSQSRWCICDVWQLSHYVRIYNLHRGPLTCFPLCLKVSDRTWFKVYATVTLGLMIWSTFYYGKRHPAKDMYFFSGHFVTVVIIFVHDYQTRDLEPLVHVANWLIHFYLVFLIQAHDLLLALCL